MTDLTDIYYGEDDLDFFNSFGFALTILIMGLLAVYGYQPPFDHALLVSALVFIPLILSAESLTQGNILQSSATPTEGAKAYLLPQLFAVFATDLSKIQLSFYSAPVSEGGYLASILAQTEPAVQAIFNNNIAPFAENFAIIAFTFLFFKFLIEAEFREKLPEFMPETFTLSVVASAPGALVFAFLHGQTSTGFFFKAFIVMLILLTMLFAEELTEQDLLPFGVTVGLTIGVHRAINLAEFGGYIKYLNILMTAQAPIIYIGYLVIIFDLVMVGIVAWDYGNKIAEYGGLV